MELRLLKAVVRPILRESQIIGYRMIDTTVSKTVLKECALTRLYQYALQLGKMVEDDLQMVAFVNEDGASVPYTAPWRGGFDEFFKRSFQAGTPLYEFAASQHMSEVGKMLISTKPIKEALTLLYNEEFAERMDTHKWLKIAQIACQPGRAYGEVEQPGEAPMPPIGVFTYPTFIDSKREDEDGMIWVNPEIWPEILQAYSYERQVVVHAGTPQEKVEDRGLQLHPSTQLIKINSSTPDFTLKGVLHRAEPEQWKQLVARSRALLAVKRGTTDFCDPDIVLCGNAIKDRSNQMEEHELYMMASHQAFAYHADSSILRGFRVNISKQIMTRSGMNTAKFLDLAVDPAIKMVKGLMEFDEDRVLEAIGAFSKQDEEDPTLQHAAAVKKRIMQHGLPANHPANALLIWRLALTVIRDRLARIDVEGFHGIGARSLQGPGRVGVPHGVYKDWLKNHGTNEAYLFRMPYLGSYGGRFVKLVPMHTDTIMVNWEDALQMEGDFDGDQYYVVPSKYISTPEETTKPYRPLKGTKMSLELNQANLHEQVISLATNKRGIGPRDSQLSTAFDLYHQALHNCDAHEVERWRANIERLQVYVQQAIEGLKHSTEEQLTEEDIREMFGHEATSHDYTKLISNRTFKMVNLQSTRLQKGYIELVRLKVKDEHSWHPLHGIFQRLAQLEFGEVANVMPYWNAVKDQKIRALPRNQISGTFAALRKLNVEYTKRVRIWNGGKNKNYPFGKCVLEPAREEWKALLAGCGDNQAKVRDLHLMLAKVAYEPQPNWILNHPAHGVRIRMGEKLQHLRGIEEFSNLPAHSLKVKPLQNKRRCYARVKELCDHKPLLDGIEHIPTGHNRRIKIRSYLPRPGALFHHLATPEMSREILDAALPKISTHDLFSTLINTIRLA